MIVTYMKAGVVNEIMLTWCYYNATKLLSSKDDPWIILLSLRVRRDLMRVNPPSIQDASDHHDDGALFLGEFRETFM